MCMEAVLSLSSLVVLSSTSTSQVGMSTVSEANSSSWVVPLASGRVCTLVGELIPPQHEGDVSVIIPYSVAGLIQSSVPIVYDGKSFAGLFKSLIIETLPVPLVPSKRGGRGYYYILLKSPAKINRVLGVQFGSSKAKGIRVPLRLDKATSDGDFGHYARVLVDMDVSSVLPTSVLLERDKFHSSFIAVEYENLPAFCSTCSSIGHLPSSCRWNKSSKVPLSSTTKSTKDIARDSRVFGDDGFQLVRTRGHDSVVVHTSVGSNLISSSTSSAGLVLSSNPSSSTVSTISEVASSSVPPMISQALQISKDLEFDDGVTDSVLDSSSSVVDPSISYVSSDVRMVHYSRTIVQGSSMFNQVHPMVTTILSRSSSHPGHTARRLMIDDCDLVGIRSQGARFTWVRGRSNRTIVERRLDRVLVSDGCISCCFPVVGSPPQVVIYKLRNLKKALKSWNWEVFGDLNSTIARKSAELHSIQLDLSNRGFSNDLFIAEASVHSKLDVLLRRQECFYRDRSRVRWLRDGDRNTSFFMPLSNVGNVSRVGRDLSIVDYVIPSLVTAAENTFLTSVLSADDIHDAVFAMDAASAPRPDGFSGSFYQRCWDVVGSDVVLAVQDFFITGVIFPGLNSSFIVLLPKLRDSISVDQFRPIVLSNFLFKISSKSLADYLARVAARIISPQQFGFIRDRHIEDCITLASDCEFVVEEVLWGGTQKNLKHIMGAFRDYGDISSQLVNWIGQLPFSYLGVPLFRGKPRKAVLRPIADKILSKFAKWKGKSLSLAGRATLIRSIITGSFVHSFMIYKWPSSLLSLINSKLRNFLWTGSCEETKLFITSDGFAFSFLRERYLKHLQKPHGWYDTSSIWSSLRKNYSSLLKEGIWMISENSQRDFWRDNWLGVPILELLGIPDYLANPLRARVSDFIHEGRWVLDDSFRARFSDLCFQIDRIVISPVMDSLVWANSRDGRVSCKTAYSQFLHDIPQVVWCRDVWSRFIPPSLSALTWLLMLNRLPTEDRLCRSGFQLASRCSICGVSSESADHLFLYCPLAVAI
ncbi:hypothetical protein LWI28_009807 [Acer negundo]|uniref:Ig-like domain-containing protein n=1 Tax=Acer negundo TaxID=4023 RepID=A0AAD5JFI4_ACENE|nr:hypothetical protein LWI28_009807 [Acer negundo]